MSEIPIAAICTHYTPYSHADVIVSKFIHGFPTDDHGLVKPRTKVVSAYLDQIPLADMGQAKLSRAGARVYESVRQALRNGGDELAVRGVLLIGEHGDYPHDELGRHMYPRRHLFEQVCGVFAETGSVCPVFIDKHLSYNWADSRWIWDRAAELGVPLMAGSSLPLGHRKPWLELPAGCRIEAAVSLGYGPLEAYGYHAIELLQSFVERRAGGETGVKAVRYLEGPAVFEAIHSGELGPGLVPAALACIEDKPSGCMADSVKEPWAFQFEYRDGLRAGTVMLNGALRTWGFAGLVDGEKVACEVHLQSGFPHAHFNYLSLNIEEMFVTGQPTYPAARTLLASGLIDAVMVSRHRGGEWVETPWLEVAYETYDSIPWRSEHPRECGANLDIWPPRG